MKLGKLAGSALIVKKSFLVVLVVIIETWKDSSVLYGAATNMIDPVIHLVLTLRASLDIPRRIICYWRHNLNMKDWEMPKKKTEVYNITESLLPLLVDDDGETSKAYGIMDNQSAVLAVMMFANARNAGLSLSNKWREDNE